MLPLKLLQKIKFKIHVIKFASFNLPSDHDHSLQNAFTLISSQSKLIITLYQLNKHLFAKLTRYRKPTQVEKVKRLETLGSSSVVYTA